MLARCFILALIFAAPLTGQDLRRITPQTETKGKAVRSKAQADDVAKEPQKYLAETLIGGRDLAGLKEQKDGSAIGHAAGNKDFPVTMTAGAYAYLKKCRSAGIVPVFKGNAQDAGGGKFRLHLSAGVNTSR